MKKAFLALFLIFDIALIAGGSYVLLRYVRKNMPVKSAAAPVVPATGAVGGSTASVKLGGNSLLGGTPTPVATESTVRKILFAYRNSTAKQVSIRADFTGWKAEPMQKAADGRWTYQAALTPGEYAYCFTVGEKIINDPANKRTKVIGRTTVSSIVVEPLAPKPAK